MIVRLSDTTLTPGQREVKTIGLVNRCTKVARRIRVCTDVPAKVIRSGDRCRRIARLQPGHTLVLRVLARVKRDACRGPLVQRVQMQLAGQQLVVRRAVARLIAPRCDPPPAVTG